MRQLETPTSGFAAKAPFDPLNSDNPFNQPVKPMGGGDQMGQIRGGNPWGGGGVRMDPKYSDDGGYDAWIKSQEGPGKPMGGGDQMGQIKAQGGKQGGMDWGKLAALLGGVKSGGMKPGREVVQEDTDGRLQGGPQKMMAPPSRGLGRNPFMGRSPRKQIGRGMGRPQPPPERYQRMERGR